MKQTTNTSFELINQGWQTLVRGLGTPKATKFMLSFSKGFGDSVKEFKKMWQGKAVKDIHQEIMRAKKKGEI